MTSQKAYEKRIFFFYLEVSDYFAHSIQLILQFIGQIRLTNKLLMFLPFYLRIKVQFFFTQKVQFKAKIYIVSWKSNNKLILNSVIYLGILWIIMYITVTYYLSNYLRLLYCKRNTVSKKLQNKKCYHTYKTRDVEQRLQSSRFHLCKVRQSSTHYDQIIKIFSKKKKKCWKSGFCCQLNLRFTK